MKARVGIGYDAHRFVEGRDLVLGGVTIPSPMGLAGHSDADVVAHAIMDALLGAAALGDIGQHFPPDDEHYRDANSMILLRMVTDMLAGDGWEVGNLDATVIAEHPRIAPFVEEMCNRIAEASGISATQVSVKATTNEGMGSIGRGEGIAAWAVANVVTRRHRESV